MSPQSRKALGRRALVTGSLAYDYILDYHGQFRPKLVFRKGIRHTVVFPVNGLRRSMGGCAGNIAYTMALLGGDPLLAAAVGADGGPYLRHLRSCGIRTGRVLRCQDALTAQAYIANDARENQLIFFFAGAMARSDEIPLSGFKGRASLAIVSPNSREAMLGHAADLCGLGIPFILDPGQGIELFSGAELRRMLQQASYAVFNRMEFERFREISGMDPRSIEDEVQALVVTDSMNGSTIWADRRRYRFKADVRGETVDPTGCGDAYRGALMHAMLEGRSWEEAGRLASRVAGIKALSRGGQEFGISEGDLAGL